MRARSLVRREAFPFRFVRLRTRSFDRRWSTAGKPSISPGPTYLTVSFRPAKETGLLRMATNRV
jgi:hypothetical protein